MTDDRKAELDRAADLLCLSFEAVLRAVWSKSTFAEELSEILLAVGLREQRPDDSKTHDAIRAAAMKYL